MKCITCEKEKTNNEFELRKDTLKYRNTCKECRFKYVKLYKQRIQNGSVKKRENPIQNGNIICKNCKIIKKLEEFPIRNDSNTGYRTICKDCKKNIMNKYYKDVYNKKRRERNKNDIQYKIMKIHRVRIWKVLTKINKSRKSIDYLGCNVDILRKWLEFQFDKDMNWNNYGKLWTIDHILPISLFNLTSENEQNIVFNWKNLQPHRDNFSKGNKIRLYEYFNSFISIHRFIQLQKLNSIEYQGLNESLNWLRQKLRYGKNLSDNNGQSASKLPN